MATGVYQITCLPTGRRYIGSAAISFAKRFAQHRHDLRKGVHKSRYMQRAWIKYGEEAFQFEVLEECAPEMCVPREQVWLDKLRPAFNTSRKAGSTLGLKHSEAVRRANGERTRARNQAKPDRGIGHMLEVVRDPVWRAKQSQRMLEAHQQGRYVESNRRAGITRSRRHLVHGEALTLQELALKYGRTVKSLARRVERGAVGDAIVAPPYFMRST